VARAPNYRAQLVAHLSPNLSALDKRPVTSSERAAASQTVHASELPCQRQLLEHALTLELLARRVEPKLALHAELAAAWGPRPPGFLRHHAASTSASSMTGADADAGDGSGGGSGGSGGSGDWAYEGLWSGARPLALVLRVWGPPLLAAMERDKGLARQLHRGSQRRLSAHFAAAVDAAAKGRAASAANAASTAAAAAIGATADISAASAVYAPAPALASVGASAGSAAGDGGANVSAWGWLSNSSPGGSGGGGPQARRAAAGSASALIGRLSFADLARLWGRVFMLELMDQQKVRTTNELVPRARAETLLRTLPEEASYTVGLVWFESAPRRR